MLVRHPALAATAAATFLAAAVGTAGAQTSSAGTMCFNRSSLAASACASMSCLTDPSWATATTMRFGAGTSDVVRVRGMRTSGGEALTLHVAVTADHYFASAPRVFYLGFTGVDATGDAGTQRPVAAVRMKFTPSNATTAAVEVVPALCINPESTCGDHWKAFAGLSGLSGAPTSAPEEYLENDTVANAIADWMDDTHIRYQVAASGAMTWEVLLTIPIGSTFGARIPADGQLWFATQLTLPSGTGTELVSVFYPREGSALDYETSETGVGDNKIVRNPSPSGGSTIYWYDYQSPATACARDVSLAWTDFGIWYGTGNQMSDALGTEIKGTQVGTTANHLTVRLQNGAAGTTIKKDEASASFALADWGSQTPAAWTPLGSGLNPAVIDPGNKGLVEQVWNVGLAELCKYSVIPAPGPGDPTADPCAGIPDARTRFRHQCVKVELANATAATAFTFAPTTMQRNMDFVQASEFTRAAMIDVRGLTAVAGDREVLLLLRPRNMSDPQAAAGSAAHVEKFRAGSYTWDKVFELLPALEVFVFHDTGRTVKFGKATTHRLFADQSSFGYFVEHEGALDRWVLRLDGAARITDHLYHVTIDAKQRRQVQNRIVAVENRGDPEPAADDPKWQPPAVVIKPGDPPCVPRPSGCCKPGKKCPPRTSLEMLGESVPFGFAAVFAGWRRRRRDRQKP